MVPTDRIASPGRMSGLVAVLLLALSVGCAATDEDRIRRQLDDIAQTISVEAGESQFIRQARATRLARYLAPDVDFDAGAPLLPGHGRDRVSQMVADVRMPSSGVSVAIADVRVTIKVETRQALATVTAVVSDADAVGGELREARTLNVVLADIGGEWLVQQVRFAGFP